MAGNDEIVLDAMDSIKTILRENNITQFDENVPKTLLNFLYGHVRGVLMDAKKISQHCGKEQVDKEDIAFALNAVNERTQMVGPQDINRRIRSLNKRKLPRISRHRTLKIPSRSDGATYSANYKLKSTEVESDDDDCTIVGTYQNGNPISIPKPSDQTEVSENPGTQTNGNLGSIPKTPFSVKKDPTKYIKPDPFGISHILDPNEANNQNFTEEEPKPKYKISYEWRKKGDDTMVLHLRKTED